MRLMVLFLLLCCGVAQATVMSIQYDSVEVIPDSNSTAHINNKSSVAFSIKSGLDRTIEGTLLKDGVQLEQKKSSLIGVSNKIGSGSEAYYGVNLEFGTITNDGNYSLQVKVLNFFGETIDEYEFPFVRDTVLPTIGNLSYTNYKRLPNRNGAWDTGLTGLSFIPSVITAENVVDGSGIRSVHAQSYIYDASGQPQPFKKAEINYDKNIRKASVNFDLSPKPEHLALFPANNRGTTKYGLRFIVTDNAGNVSQNTIQPLYWNNYNYPTIEPYAVYNPYSSNIVAGVFRNYELYRPHITVYDNPIHVLYRIPKSDYQGYSIGGVRAVGYINLHTDANYVYALFKLTHSNYNGNFYRFDTQLRWSGSYLSPKVTLASSARKTPVRITSPEYLYSDIGWGSYHRWLVQNHQLPLTITHVRQQVEARSYPQVFSHRGGSCTIPAGATSCIIHLGTLSLNRGTNGYLHDMSTLKSSDGILESPASWADVSWNDRYYPNIRNVIYDNETKTLSASVNQPEAGLYFDMLRLKDVRVVDVDNNELPATELSLIRNGHDYLVEWDLKSLDEGLHNLYILARENHGPEHKVFALEYDNDTHSPGVTLGYEAHESFPDVVGDIRHIYFDVIDRYSTTSKIALKGLGIDIQLGYSFHHELDDYKRYNLELPKAFPTLKEDQFYTLTVDVTDEYGNTTSVERQIRYVPSNLIITDVQPYLTVDQSLQNNVDIPMARIYTEEYLITGFGQIATGVQLAEVQLSTDSTIPINVRIGERHLQVEPGMIRSVPIDLGSEGGRLDVEIYPALKDVEGRADYLLSIPQLTSME